MLHLKQRYLRRYCILGLSPLGGWQVQLRLGPGRGGGELERDLHGLPMAREEKRGLLRLREEGLPALGWESHEGRQLGKKWPH